MFMQHMGEDVLGKRYLLSGMTRWSTVKQQELITLLRSNVEGFISDYRVLGVSDKARKLLEYVKFKTRFPGDEVEISLDIDYPVAFCGNTQEFSYYLKFLAESELVTRLASTPLCTITPKGWRWLDEQSQINVDSPKAFVAMWFDDNVKAVYEDGIEPAVRLAGYEPIKINLKEYIGKVDDEIIAEIRQSRFLVADFTGHRRGVYFEAGFAMGLGIEVIWCCRKDEIDKLHFDIRNYNCIAWKNPSDLREKLERRILAVIGKGPKEPK